MSPTKQINLRAHSDHHDLLRTVNDRLKGDPAFEGLLRTMIEDRTATEFMPARDVRAEFHKLHRRLEDLEIHCGLRPMILPEHP